MKAERIQISHFPFIIVKQVEIKRKIGEHAYAKVIGYIEEEKTKEYQRTLFRDIWVSITATEEGGESKILMTGIVAGFSLEKQPHSSLLTLEIMSGTYQMDATSHFRTFQNTTQTYQEVINQINRGYRQAQGITEDVMDKTSCAFHLQYQETDWEFVKRLASQFGLLITPSVTREGAFYQIGNAHHVTHRLPKETNYSVLKRVDQFMVQGSNGEPGFEQDFIFYTITVREVYDLWDLVLFGNNGGYVFQIQSESLQEELVHTYSLCPIERIRTAQRWNEKQSGCSFEAVVKAVRQAEVQVSLLGDENEKQEITTWFPYSTGYASPDGPAWYCMPEVGDTVRLQLPDLQEGHAYVISAVHPKTEQARRDPEQKSFRTKYGKELLFTPTTLELTNHQGTFIKIIDGEGIQMVSSDHITIEAGETMTLSSEQASLLIAGTNQVDIRQGSAGLHMEDDITFSGGKFRIQ